ncbi:TetR/AcrR family transcriptional regulator [Roseburia sp. 499]|uniref:TetR/AcrR family transcriptional regulator n=1 Tax=Roseburia sp. 499 TaxID=1261634 RepID=UPI0009528B45|nr:TetR/AcrR family transcriptional regulator [Roseburia sp. 499]WVK71175.1 TetR/AcrR family transcriptional regulator [Roseburia sp. 499]
MRIVKEHDERKNEIIDTAERLFAMKGYEQCSVNDILTEIGIAKGTFYHYFKSKEEVLDAVIGKSTGMIAERVTEVVDNKSLAPDDKVLQVFLAMKIENQMEEGFLEEMHKVENTLMHQKSLVSIIEVLTPILTQVVEEGNQSGAFHCEYPEQFMQIFLSSAITLLDDGIFQVAPEKIQGLFIALVAVLEKMLGVEKGRFWKRIGEYLSAS